jgi:hypothetical protein
MMGRTSKVGRAVPGLKFRRTRLQCWATLLILGLLCAAAGFSRAAELQLSEAQVKALFLYNFAKYVDWPDATFAQADAPIVIGVMGDSGFSDTLEKSVAGKRVGGRGIVVKSISEVGEDPACQILFVPASQKHRTDQVLTRLKGKPVLTVGETDEFLKSGGMINFFKKEGKVRLEIDLRPAREAKLHVNAKLLSVADVVRGKT